MIPSRILSNCAKYCEGIATKKQFANKDLRGKTVIIKYLANVHLQGTFRVFLLQIGLFLVVKDMIPLHYFLGIQPYFQRDDLFVCQENHISDLRIIVEIADCALMLTHLPLQLGKMHCQEELFSKST